MAVLASLQPDSELGHSVKRTRMLQEISTWSEEQSRAEEIKSNQIKSELNHIIEKFAHFIFTSSIL